MEQERPRVFFVKAHGKELYDKVKFKYSNKEKTFTPDSVLDLKRALPKLSTGELDLRESTIPNAGNGVFAGRDFSKNEILTYYDGPVMTYEKASTLDTKTHHIAIVTGRAFVIVGNLLKSGEPITDPRVELANLGVGAFLNDARDERKNNVEFVILDMKENQRIWVERVKNARKMDPSNTTTVRTWMPKFDQLILTNQEIKQRFTLLRRIIIVRALRDLTQGEELFVSYGTGYEYFGGQKRAADEKELKEDNREKRQKCESCFKLTVYIDPLTGLYYCSPECHFKECG